MQFVMGMQRWQLEVWQAVYRADTISNPARYFVARDMRTAQLYAAQVQRECGYRSLVTLVEVGIVRLSDAGVPGWLSLKGGAAVLDCPGLEFRVLEVPHKEKVRTPERRTAPDVQANNE